MVRAAAAVLLASAMLASPVGAAVSAGATPDDLVEVTSAPPTTLAENPFLPENTAVNLSDCVSALPRPECGSRERGGWRQAAVFGAVVAGLAAVGARLVISLRRRS